MARIGFAARRARRSCWSARRPAGARHLGQSIYLRDIHGREDGPPPPVDLAHERKVGDFVRALIARAASPPRCTIFPTAGLRSALAEMAMASGIGADGRPAPSLDRSPQFFGEDQGRYVVTVGLDPEADEMRALWAEAKALGILAPWIGTTGGAELKLGDARAIPILVATNWFRPSKAAARNRRLGRRASCCPQLSRRTHR